MVISKNTLPNLVELTKKEFKDPRIIYLLAKDKNKLVGVVIISIARDIDKTAFLGELFIKEKYRQKGVGRRLMKTAERIIKKKGLNKLQVTVACNNKDAQEFYSNLGFQRKKRNYTLLEKNLA